MGNQELKRRMSLLYHHYWIAEYFVEYQHGLHAKSVTLFRELGATIKIKIQIWIQWKRQYFWPSFLSKRTYWFITAQLSTHLAHLFADILLTTTSSLNLSHKTLELYRPLTLVDVRLTHDTGLGVNRCYSKSNALVGYPWTWSSDGKTQILIFNFIRSGHIHCPSLHYEQQTNLQIFPTVSPVIIAVVVSFTIYCINYDVNICCTVGPHWV